MVESFGAGFMAGQGGGNSYEFNRRNQFDFYIDTFDTPLLCQTTSFPQIEMEQTTVWHYNSNVKVAGKPNVPNIKVELLDTPSPDIFTELLNWHQASYNSTNNQTFYSSNYKKSGKLVQYDLEGNVVRTITLTGMWLLKSPGPEDALDYSAHEPMKLVLEISVDNITFS